MKKKLSLNYEEVGTIKNIIDHYINQYSNTKNVVTFLHTLKKNKELFAEYYNSISKKYHLFLDRDLKNNPNICADYEEQLQKYYGGIQDLMADLKLKYYGGAPLTKKVKKETVPMTSEEVQEAYNKELEKSIEKLKKDIDPIILETEEKFLKKWNSEIVKTKGQYIVHQIIDLDYLPEDFIMNDIEVLDFMLP